MVSVTINGACPECGKEALILRQREKDSDVFCNGCNQVVMTEVPNTPEARREIINAIADVVRAIQKTM